MELFSPPLWFGWSPNAFSIPLPLTLAFNKKRDLLSGPCYSLFMIFPLSPVLRWRVLTSRECIFPITVEINNVWVAEFSFIPIFLLLENKIRWENALLLWMKNIIIIIITNDYWKDSFRSVWNFKENTFEYRWDKWKISFYREYLHKSELQGDYFQFNNT